MTEREHGSRRVLIDKVKREGSKEARDLMDLAFMINNCTLAVIKKVEWGGVPWKDTSLMEQEPLFRLKAHLEDLGVRIREYAG